MATQAMAAEPAELPLRWKPLLGLGLVLILFGTLALVVSFVATLASVLGVDMILIGWSWVVVAVAARRR